MAVTFLTGSNGFFINLNKKIKFSFATFITYKDGFMQRTNL